MYAVIENAGQHTQWIVDACWCIELEDTNSTDNKKGDPWHHSEHDGEHSEEVLDVLANCE